MALAKERCQQDEWLRFAEVVTSREEVVRGYVADGDVLDLGVVDSRRSVESTEQRLTRFSTSLHESIRAVNPRLLGIDIDAEGVAVLRARGHNVVCADVETMQLSQQFDVIMNGELIEHLANPGRALDSLRAHLKPHGRLILSTCNPFYIGQLWKIARYNDVQVHNEHTCWFDPHTLGQLLVRHGIRVERMYWIRQRRCHGQVKQWPTRWRRYLNPNFLMIAARQPSPGDAEDRPSPRSNSVAA